MDWSPRQIERWWRRRRLQGKPSEMQRFRETTWRFMFYFLAFWLGLYVVITVSVFQLDVILQALCMITSLMRKLQRISCHCWEVSVEEVCFMPGVKETGSD